MQINYFIIQSFYLRLHHLINLMKVQNIILFCVLVSVNGYTDEIFLNYAVDVEGVTLFQFFHNVTDGYYIDIGAYDSIFASNTLNLQTMGWDGINIDASPSRLPRFIYSRPWEPSLNYAIGDQDEQLTLFQLAQDSSSTVSPRVKDYVQNFKPVMGQTKVPSLSMRQICERFYDRRPLFINLDIEGYGSKALSTNDWKNQKCKPDIIFSQINQESIVSGLPLPELILLKQGYKKWKNTVGLNQIYILQQLYDQYQRTFNEGEKLMKNKTILNIYTIANYLSIYLQVRTTLATHHEPTSDAIYYHFTKYNEIVDIYQLNKHSNQISHQKDRPILVLNFNPHSNTLLLRSQNYSTSVITSPENFTFYSFTVYREDSSNFTAYVFDHFIKPLTKPKLVVQNQPHRPPKQNLSLDYTLYNENVSTNEKVMKIIEFELRGLNEKMKNFYSQNYLRNKQLVLTLTTNHFYDREQFEKLFKNIQRVQKSIQQKKIEGSDSSLNTKERKQRIYNVLKKLVFALFAIFFAFLFIIALLCLIRNESNLQNEQSYTNNQIVSAEQISTISEHQHHDISPQPKKQSNQIQEKEQGQDQSSDEQKVQAKDQVRA